MDPRTTVSRRADDRSGRPARSRRRPPVAARRPGLYLSVATAGALMVNVIVGADPAAQAEAGASKSVSVAAELGLTASSSAADTPPDLQPLQQLAASRSTREAEQTAAAQAQAAADQAERDRRKAEAEAAARAAAEAAAAAAAAEAAKAAKAAEQAEAKAAKQAEAEQAEAGAAASAGTGVSEVARISNSAGPVRAVAQAAANAVVSNVPGAGSITIGGTRGSATDPGGHPSGRALDYMVMSDSALGDAIVEYHIAHWDELRVDYIIWEQRYLDSPGGSWRYMEDRGGATANHMDHPHVNYRG